MDTLTNDSSSKRTYRRRTDEERIAELQAQLAELQDRKRLQSRRNDPLVIEIPKIKKRLLKFAQLAMDSGRGSIANSVTAFNAGLEHTLRQILAEPMPSASPIEDLPNADQDA